MAEIAINKFEPKTWARMTGMKLPMNADKQAAQQQLQQLQQQGQQAIQQAQAAGITDPSQAPPELQQQAQQMQAQAKQLQDLLAQPSWEDVLQSLKENVKDNFLIDIQTNSTLDATVTEDKADITALVGAISQMMQALGPAIQSGAIPMPLVKMLLMSMLQTFRFGDEIMEMIRKLPDQMPQQQDPKQDAAAQTAQAQQALLKSKLDFQEKSDQMDLQKKQADMGFQQQELDMRREEMAFEHESKMQELQDKRAARQEQAAQQRQTAQARFNQTMLQLATPQPQGVPGAGV